jgi:hypothetical protein
MSQAWDMERGGGKVELEPRLAPLPSRSPLSLSIALPSTHPSPSRRRPVPPQQPDGLDLPLCCWPGSQGRRALRSLGGVVRGGDPPEWERVGVGCAVTPRHIDCLSRRPLRPPLRRGRREHSPRPPRLRPARSPRPPPPAASPTRSWRRWRAGRRGATGREGRPGLPSAVVVAELPAPAAAAAEGGGEGDGDGDGDGDAAPRPDLPALDRILSGLCASLPPGTAVVAVTQAARLRFGSTRGRGGCASASASSSAPAASGWRDGGSGTMDDETAAAATRAQYGMVFVHVASRAAVAAGK